jgi:hypothetical protein
MKLIINLVLIKVDLEDGNKLLDSDFVLDLDFRLDLDFAFNSILI